MNMTVFPLSEFLCSSTLQALGVSTDNAAGHGNHQARELSRKRHHCRIQSQHYMCRKPERMDDEDYLPSEVQPGNTQHNHAPQSSSTLLNSTTADIPCREKLCFRSLPSVREVCRANASKLAAIGVSDKDKKLLSNNTFLEKASSTQNVSMPRRRNSEDFEPIGFVDDDANNLEDRVSESESKSMYLPPDQRSLSLLAEILSSIDL